MKPWSNRQEPAYAAPPVKAESDSGSSAACAPTPVALPTGPIRADRNRALGPLLCSRRPARATSRPGFPTQREREPEEVAAPRPPPIRPSTGLPVGAALGARFPGQGQPRRGEGRALTSQPLAHPRGRPQPRSDTHCRSSRRQGSHSRSNSSATFSGPLPAPPVKPRLRGVAQTQS